VKDHPEGVKHLVALKNIAPLPEGRLEEKGKQVFIRFEDGGIQVVLPLGMDAMVQCTTCHDPHASPGGRPLMLRTADRDALCRGCHGEGFRKESE
jgi:predicted CXXCH cytochrome family protein